MRGWDKFVNFLLRIFEQKKRIRYGCFTRWATEYLPFDIRTAQNYMKLYICKEELERKEITTISDAYAALEGEATPEEIIEVDDSIDISSKPTIVNTWIELDNMLSIIPTMTKTQSPMWIFLSKKALLP